MFEEVDHRRGRPEKSYNITLYSTYSHLEILHDVIREFYINAALSCLILWLIRVPKQLEFYFRKFTRDDLLLLYSLNVASCLVDFVSSHMRVNTTYHVLLLFSRRMVYPQPAQHSTFFISSKCVPFRGLNFKKSYVFFSSEHGMARAVRARLVSFVRSTARTVLLKNFIHGYKRARGKMKGALISSADCLTFNKCGFRRHVEVYIAEG